MKCENLQFNLPVYLDDFLNAEERACIDEHLAQCPLCRQKSAEFQALRNDLRVLQRPELSVNSLALLRNRVASETRTIERKPSSLFSQNFREWLLMRFMPYSVGTIASVLLTFGLLWSLLLNTGKISPNNEISRLQTINKSSVLLANTNPKSALGDSEINATGFDALPALAIFG